MGDRIDVVEDFIIDLKNESKENQTIMTIDDEDNIRDALTTEVKNLKDIDPSEYMKVLEIRLNAPGKNIFTTNGIDLDAIKLIAKETKDIVVSKRKEKAKVKVNPESNIQEAKPRDEQTSEEKQTMPIEEAMRLETEGHVDTWYPNVSSSTKDELVDEMGNARKLKAFVEEQVKLATERGENVDVKKLIFENAKNFGLLPEMVELNLMRIFDQDLLGFKNPSAEDIIKYIESSPVTNALFTKEMKEIIRNAAKEIQQNDDSKTQSQQEVTKNGSEEQAVEDYNLPIWLNVRNVFLNKFTLEAIENLETSINIKKEDIKREERISHDGEDLAKFIIEKEKFKHQIVKEKGILAAREGKENPMIPADLKARVLQEFANNGQTAANIYNKLVSEGLINEINGLSCYDVIAIISDELQAQGLSKKDARAFREIEEEIYKNTVKIQVKESILARKDTLGLSKKESDTRDAELFDLRTKRESYAQKVIKYRMFLHNKGQSFIPTEPLEQEARDGTEVDFSSGVGKDNLTGLIKREGVTEQDVAKEQKGIRKIVEYIKSKVFARKPKKDMEVVTITTPENEETTPIVEDAKLDDEVR